MVYVPASRLEEGEKGHGGFLQVLGAAGEAFAVESGADEVEEER